MKKLFLVLTASLVLFLSVNIQNSYAAVPIFSRVVAGSAGERVLIGIAEKAGMKYTTKTARKKAIEKWNMDVYEKIKYYDKVGETYKADELRHFQNLMANVTPAEIAPLAENAGMGKYIVTSAMFLLGADLLYEGYKSIVVSQNNEDMVERMKEEAAALRSGEKIASHRGARAFTFFNGGYDQWAFGVPTQFTGLADKAFAHPEKPMFIDIKSVTELSDFADKIVFDYTGFNIEGVPFESFGNETTIDKTNYTEDFTRIISPIIPEELPDITDLPWIQPYHDTGTVPQYIPEEVPVNLPVDDSYPETIAEPWNEPESFSPPVEEPAPEPDPGDGGTTPPPEPPTDGQPTNPFKKLIPTAILLAFLDLFRAIVEYLIRMFTFVLTIPLVSAKPIDNAAFVWFREARIMGVQIYNVVSSLASLGLSFAVYKSIRRILP